MAQPDGSAMLQAYVPDSSWQQACCQACRHGLDCSPATALVGRCQCGTVPPLLFGRLSQSSLVQLHQLSLGLKARQQYMVHRIRQIVSSPALSTQCASKHACLATLLVAVIVLGGVDEIC